MPKETCTAICSISLIVVRNVDIAKYYGLAPSIVIDIMGRQKFERSTMSIIKRAQVNSIRNRNETIC